MSNNSNKDDKSKIDKIREDLEKKLAALEKSKLNASESESTSDKNEVTNPAGEETDIKENIIEEEVIADKKASFIDQISSIENETIVTDKENDKVSNENIAENDDTIFEISDEIEVVPEIEEEKQEKVVPPIVTSDKEKIDFNQIERDKQVKEVNTPTNKFDDNINEQEQGDEEIDDKEEKSSKTNFLMYGLIGLLLLGVAYFTLDYLKGKDKLNSDITNKKIDELENRRYQDSIKLLEAEKRLAEFESQRYIDSIAEADRLKLSVVPNNTASDNTDKPVKKAKKSKPTTTIYKNNKPVVTSSSNVNFDEVVASNPSNKNTTSTSKDKPSSDSSQDAAVQQALKDEKDKKIAKEVKKEKKIETLNTVAKAPVYPGCERKGTEIARKTCMISKINKFVNKNFNTYVAQNLGLDSGRQKIFVSFIIDKNGYVNILRTRAKHESLKKEAVRVVNKLPRMKPAIDKNGKKTQLVYNLPIVFSIEE